ncbi:hypothetical protein HJC23_007583 [Cyclotella cryptica]|uniref:FHA domain-containing protein n=1 Tax=Cyclotella cryptica TaxID=29204 RepID=A0ABD3QTD1_9STRA|eukprot:CCRYP_002864-RA/>CCRYP_002864-RA protein AED:0.01 eAED:0.01 QI:50/1/1/1/1/1/2/197/897
MNLDNELDIPTEATLSLLSSVYSPAMLLLQASHECENQLGGLITIPCTNGNDVENTISIPICGESSSRSFSTCSSESSNTVARSLIIGRQASSVDIRVDHKSVSRRHTAIYYVVKSKEEGDDALLVVQDLGGKHGTIVDGVRLEKNGKIEIPFHPSSRDRVKRELELQFGSAPAKCRLVLPEVARVSDELQSNRPTADNDQMKNHESSEISFESKVNAITLNSNEEKQNHEDLGTLEPSTRESREAQIAAMIASFDSEPVYKRYVPPSEENDADFVSNEIQLSKRHDNCVGTQQNETNKFNLPITASIQLSPGSNSFSSSDGTNTPLQVTSSVSALCFEPSGSRLVAGHRDGTLRFYDFHGMKPATSASTSDIYYPPFRIVDSDNDPLDSTGRHVITCVGPSPSGAQWIIGTTSSQPKVIDREGSATLFHFIKGDTYVTDSSNTKGHTAPVTGVGFHPLIKDICWTCSLDGSIRQWDVSGKGKTQFQKLICQKVVGKCKNEKGQRTQIVSNIGVHPSGRKIVVGTACGSIQVWNCFGSGMSSRPLGAVYSAHGGSKPVTYVTYSCNGERIASRSDSDDTVRIWDASLVEKNNSAMSRKFSVTSGSNDMHHPASLLLGICKGLPALNETANCAFSPDGKIVCAGSSIEPNDKSSNACGKIKFYQLQNECNNVKSKGTPSTSSSKRDIAIIDPIIELDVAPKASVLGVVWHPKLNQIAFGTSNGVVQVLYDPILSKKGAIVPASRSIRQSDGLSDLLRSRAPTGSAAYLTSSSQNDNIITPNALPLFRDEPRATRKTKERDRKDPEKTKLPEPPIAGGIRTGAQAGAGINFTQYIVESTNYVKNKNIAGRDPRAELFKYNEGKSYASKAYEGDVQKILAEKTVEEEEEEMKSSKRFKTK